MMKTFLFVLILSLALISTAAAQPGRDVFWTQADSALYPFARAGSAVLYNYFYCFGGNSSNTAQAFNLTTELWEESTPSPYGYQGFTGVAANDAIYLIGRWDGYAPCNEVQRFTPSGGGPTGTWTQMEPYPLETFQSAAAWDGGNFIYAAGGYGAGNFYACRYDIALNHWTEITSLPNWRNQAGGAFVLSKFYVVGGWAAHAATLEYDPMTDLWTEKAQMPVWVPCVTWCTTFNDSLVFVVGGGGVEGWPMTNAIQVYNPLTNTWTMETPAPEVLGFRNARFVPPDKVISAGGSVQIYLTTATYKGTGFPLGSPSSHLTVSLVPFVQPIQIPASGGTLDFYLFVDNSASFSQEVEIWTKVIAPGGIFGPLMGPATVEMDTGARGWLRHQNVPGRWASGLYTYIAYVGDYPTGNIWATDSLQFTKLTTGDGPGVGDWNCTGEEVEIGETPSVASIHPSSLILHPCVPNPFNPSTVIRYKMQVARHVSLRIYNTAGRLVTELVNGWRDAGSQQITFDGSGLPSGIYFAKLQAGGVNQVQKLVLLK